jgi:zona occludens toxin
MRISARSKQRGFLYLTTGANGAGKTLNTLKWVRERQVKESREVFYNGRFDMIEGGELDSWKKFDFKDWQTLPDGALIVLDECHNDLPVRSGSAPPPESVRMLAEHRKRGFDFYLISQHPQNIDLFVRRLIGSPGWHRHLKRTFGADMVSVLEWSAVKGDCEKTGASKDAKVSMVGFPKEVYKWYNSASLHTGKKSIPWQVWGLLAAVVIIPAMIYFAYQALKPKVIVPPGAVAVAPGQVNLFAPGQVSQGNRTDEKKPLTPEEYAKAFQARIPGFPQSAARYDGVQTVTQAPKPAACVHGKRPGEKAVSCKCYSQQATPLDTPLAVCVAIAAGGFFDDTLLTGDDAKRSLPPVAVSVPPAVQVAQAEPAFIPVHQGYGLRSVESLQARLVKPVVPPDLGKQPQ